MAFDKFLIAPIKSGLQENLRPWLIPEDSFETMNNAYIFRGRVRKRFGSNYMNGSDPNATRLRIDIGVIGGGGVLLGNAPGHIWKIGQTFSVATVLFTVTQAGFHVMTSNTAGAAGTFDTATGAFAFNVPAFVGTHVYFYPNEPVMGLCRYEVGPIDNQTSYAFDTQFVYAYNGASWGLAPAWVITDFFQGNNLNFFDTENWTAKNQSTTGLFITNFNATVPVPAVTDDDMWYYDGTTWTQFFPYFNPAGGAVKTGPYVATARIIVAFKDRLLLLNTIENDGGVAPGTNSAYPNRCRFSANGNPTADNAWYEPNVVSAGGLRYFGGGWIDAATKEAIISAEFIKDRLIVFFEHSTWELAYTGNQIQPFSWQKINTELGSDAIHATVPFDKAILTVGKTGVHSCNGANVERIDDKIPAQVFNITAANAGITRVAGIRDYYTEMVYWAIPYWNQSAVNVYPNKVLVYNYSLGNWAFNDDCITCFDYNEQQSDLTWESIQGTWAENGEAWNAGVNQPGYRRIIAGNQQGWVFEIDPDNSVNAAVMQLTDIDVTTLQLTIINHNCEPGEWIKINNSPLNGGDQIYQVNSVVDINTITINNDAPGFDHPYLGGAYISRVSQIDIKTKQFNPYVDKGVSLQLGKVNFCVLASSAGSGITVDWYTSASSFPMLQQADNSGSILGTNFLETSPYPTVPLEASQQRLWHPVYMQADGQFVQLRLYWTDLQMVQPAIVEAQFELEGMILFTRPTSQTLE